MKNIHILPTDQPSKLAFDIDDNFYLLCEEPVFFKHQELVENRNIYITSSEEIKEGNWYLDTTVNVIFKNDKLFLNGTGYKKIILTTDSTLIVDGVQAIDGEFLEWFVKNPTCEFVEVIDFPTTEKYNSKGVYVYNNKWIYKIIIPQEEPKQEFLLFDKERADTITSEGQKTVRELQNTIQQETLEEAAENESEYLADWEDKSMYVRGFVDGAKYQAERMYSEEELKIAYNEGKVSVTNSSYITTEEWFEQFKKK